MSALTLVLLATSGVVLAPGAAGAPGTPSADDPPDALDGVDLADWDETAAPEPVPWEDSPTIAPSPPDEQEAPRAAEAAVELPEAGDWQVSLAQPGEMGEVVGDDAAAGPVEVGVADKRADGRAVPARVADRAEGKDLQVTVHDRAVARRAGVTGFVFELEGDGSAASAGAMVDAGEVPLELDLDYSGCADAYGSGYAEGLRVVALPACALEDPVPTGCNTRGVPVPSRNDLDGERLVVDRADLAAVGDRVAESNAELQALPAGGAGPGAGFRAAMAAGAADIRATGAGPPATEPCQGWTGPSGEHAGAGR